MCYRARSRCRGRCHTAWPMQGDRDGEAQSSRVVRGTHVRSLNPRAHVVVREREWLFDWWPSSTPFTVWQK